MVAKAKRLLVSPCFVSDANDDDDEDFPFDLRAISSRAAKGLPLFRRVTAKAT